MRSGLGVMLLISLIGAAIIAPRRLSFLYAALASIALLLEQSYWVLAHDAPTTDFLQPSLLAMGCFAGAGITGWLAQRVAANERLARQRGRELETQTRVNQLVIAGHARRRAGARPRRARGAAQPAGAAPARAPSALLGVDIASLVPRFAESWGGWRSGQVAAAAPANFQVRGRDIGLRLLDTGAAGRLPGAVHRGHDARARAGAAAQARGARPAHRQHRARDPQPARRHQPRRGAPAGGKARRRTASASRTSSTTTRCAWSGWCPTCCSSPPRPHVDGADPRCGPGSSDVPRRVRRQRVGAAQRFGVDAQADLGVHVRPRAPAPGAVEPAAQRRALRARGARRGAHRAATATPTAWS